MAHIPPRLRGERNRHPAITSGFVPWQVPEGAEFDLIEPNGYNAHANIAWGQNPWKSLPDVATTLEEVGVAEHSHIHFEEIEEEWESFYGVVPIRPVIRGAYLEWEPDPWDGWDAEQMYVALEGRLPPEELPEPDEDVPLRRCGKCGQPGHNIQTCDTPWHRRPRKAGPAKRKQLRKVRRCSECGRTGHNKTRCPRLVVATPKKSVRRKNNKGTYICSACGERGHNRRTCEQVTRV